MDTAVLNILITGQAGQGLQTVGHLFAKSLSRAGYHIHTDQTFESRIRGGYSTFAVRAGNKAVFAPSDVVDLALSLVEKNVKTDMEKLSDKGLIIGHKKWEFDDKRFLGVPFETFGEQRYWNMAGLAILAELIGLDREFLYKALEERFAPGVADKNIEVVKAAIQWAGDQDFSLKKLPESEPHAPRRWLMNGHESAAFGAVSGGIKFCSFYPMSPSTSVPQTLINHAGDLDLVIEQVEDEICALNMALGAAYCGAPALVTTSGGGFALMTEALSLSGASETPVVVVVAQRPGPATGLPTRTEQGDLELVLYSGHGEFPRAVYAPSNVEEGFYLMRQAVETAEKFQIPVMVLTDHYLSGSYQDISPVDVEGLLFVEPGKTASVTESPYLRYRMTPSGVSPRLLPGQGEHLVVADSHEHFENGHICEDLQFRTRLVEKRLKKFSGLKSEVVPPEMTGQTNPDLLLVSWGSAKGAVREAAEKLEGKNIKTAMLHFSQLWPLDPDQFLDALTGAKRIIGVEGNATGQLCRLIRQESGFEIKERVLRYDGLAMTSEYILERLNQ